MNKKLLCAALLAGLGVAQAASAQEFDDRWYLTGSAGFNLQDNDRQTNNAAALGLGLGKFISPNWSIDGELNYQNPNFSNNQNLNWSQYGVSVDMRRHFNDDNRGWHPYILGGLGYQQSDEEFDAFPNPNSPGQRKDGNFAAKVGAGIQSSFDKRFVARAEVAYRADFDGNSVAAPDESWFGDLLVNFAVVVPLGPVPVAEVAAAPVAPVAPTAPAPITIDLNGVNFDFDKATLRPDAVAILGEATEILKRYPDLRVEVAGHTDLCGAADYNQRLSERRATVVYSYFTSNGIDSSRLVGPVGYGESRPLEPTAQTFPACKNERNRRTELNVQN